MFCFFFFVYSQYTTYDFIFKEFWFYDKKYKQSLLFFFYGYQEHIRSSYTEWNVLSFRNWSLNKTTKEKVYIDYDDKVNWQKEGDVPFCSCDR